MYLLFDEVPALEPIKRSPYIALCGQGQHRYYNTHILSMVACSHPSCIFSGYAMKVLFLCVTTKEAGKPGNEAAINGPSPTKHVFQSVYSTSGKVSNSLNVAYWS